MPISPVLSKLLDLLPGDRPANGPVTGNQDDGPSTTGLPGPDPSDILPPGIAQRIAERGPDALPPGIARQLADFTPSPPATSGPVPSSTPTPMSTPSTTPMMPGGPATPAPATDPVTQIINQIVQPSGRSQGPAGPIPLEQAMTERFPPGLANRVVTMAMPQGATPSPAPPLSQPQQAVPAQTPASSTPMPGANPAQAPRTAGNAVPNSVPPPTANANAVPARADALPAPQGRPEAALAARGEQTLMDRAAAMMGRPMGAVVTGAALAPAAAQAAQIMGQTAQVVPLSQMPVDSRGIVLSANDRAMGARTEPVLGTPIYTADGPGRRRPRRLTEALPAQLTRWLWLTGLSGNPAAMRDPDPEKDGWFALQWLYWLLAIVAYGCLALALIAMLPSAADVFGGRGGGFSRTTLVVGVIAAAAAWWLARRMTRR